MPRKGDGPSHLDALLEGVLEAPIPEDEYEFEHMTFLRHHPAFLEALERLREDLATNARAEHRDTQYEPGRRLELTRELLLAARSDPDTMDYPARKFAEEWDIPVSAAYHFALDEFRGPTPTKHDLPEAQWFAIKETPLEYVIRLPRPISPARRQAVVDWVEKQQDSELDGAVWGKSGKYVASPKAVAALPWFESWNSEEGRLPAEIWNQLPSEGRPAFENFHANLVSVWERMRSISPEGVREDRPSKAQP